MSYKFIKHGGGVAPLLHIRVDQIAVVGEIYGSHGEQDHFGKKRFGPFVDLVLNSGYVVTLENCIAPYESSIGTQAVIMQEINE